MSLEIENWTRRRNYRLFDNSVAIPESDSAKLDRCLIETPIQVGLPVVLLKLENTPEDRAIKDWLAKEYFYNDIGRHMVAVASAPLVYIPVLNPDPAFDFTPESLMTTAGHQAGIHGDAVMAAALELGWDFAFIGCAVLEDHERVRPQWEQMIRDRFGIELNKVWPWPIVSFCVGRGIDDQADWEHTEWKDYKLENGETLKYQPLPARDQVRKLPGS